MGSSPSVYAKRVIVVGGGYAGASVAQQLSSSFEVTLIEKDDSLTHHVGAPRGIVEPGFEQQLRLDYATTVGDRGRVVQARATSVAAGRVELDNGDVLEADFVVVAVGGSGYRSPLRSGGDSTSSADYLAAQRRAQGVIRDAARVLVVGGGSTGLEIVGEITEAYPDKQVVLVESGGALLKNAVGLSPKLEPAVRQHLAELGVELRLGVRVAAADLPEGNQAVVASPAGKYALSDGSSVQADAIVVATGQAVGPPAAAALFGGGSDSNGTSPYLDDRGLVRVDEHLQVPGLANVFAVGDTASLPEAKTMANGMHHADYVAKEILARAKAMAAAAEDADSGGGCVPAPSTTRAYRPKGSMLALTMGRGWGAMSVNGSSLPGMIVKMVKGKDLMVGRVAKQLGLVTRPADAAAATAQSQ